MIMSCNRLLIPMKILFERNLPMKELRMAKVIIDTNTTLYVIFLPFFSSSVSESSFANLLVRLKARNKLTASVHKLITM